MSVYRHILCAVDFASQSERIGERAASIARQYGARLSLLHVVEYLPLALDNELLLPPSAELETQLMDHAARKLEEYAQRLSLEGTAVRRVVLGSTKLEIIRYAESEGIDLIVLGSHGRHGLARMLGSTANAVIHSAPCDVLAVRISAGH